MAITVKSGTGNCQRNLVHSRKDWWREFQKWQKEAQSYVEDNDDDDDAELNLLEGNSKWLPHLMKLLFGKESVSGVDTEMGSLIIVQGTELFGAKRHYIWSCWHRKKKKRS